MLERIREGSQGTWAIVILGLVILSFVFTGIGGYISSSTGTAVAEVNGEEIPTSTLERAYENERARMESQFGEAFSALTADSSYLNEFRRSILDRLIGDKLIEQSARDLGLRVGDEQIREQIRSMTEFQIGGQFNNDRYQAILRQAGFQPSSFRDYMRSEMIRQQVARALLGSEFALDQEAQRIYQLQQQSRDIKYITVPAEPFVADITVSDEEANAFYQKNLVEFDTEEKVSVAYVELSLDDILPLVDVSEDELMAAYEQSSADFRTEEQRRASHILIEFGDDKSAARETAEAALARVQSGEDFATVAMEVSDDTFSAENGGDLDFFTAGMMDPTFEQATFELEAVGDVSQVVESEFGFHVIKLTDVKDAQITPFEQVRDELTAQVKEDKAIEEFYVIQQNIAEVAYEMPDSLQEVAALANKQVITTELFTRQQPPEAVSNPVVLAAAFSDDLIESKMNSDVLEIEENHIMVVRVAEHQAQRTKTFDEVKSDILTRLTADKAQQAAVEWANNILHSLQAGEDVSTELAAKSLSWQEQDNLTRFGSPIAAAYVEKAFQLSAEQGNNQAVVELASGDVGILQVNSINDAEPAPQEQLGSLQERIASARSQSMYSNLIEALKADADITVFQL